MGNWAGVTVERKEAVFDIGDDRATLVDLPGVYSLSPYSIEENITRHFIAQHQPDVVLNIVDATNLERNLYLTLHVMELERPVVVALNLMDELKRRGESIDCARLSQALGAPVVPISAKRRQGFDELFQAIHDQAHNPRAAYPARFYDASTRDALREIVEALGGFSAHSAFDVDEHFEHRDQNERDDDHSPRAGHRHIGGYDDEGDVDYAPPTMWVALKLLEGDELLKETAQLSENQRARIRAAVKAYVARGQAAHPGIDSLTLVVDARYRRIDELLETAGYRRRERELDFGQDRPRGDEQVPRVSNFSGRDGADVCGHVRRAGHVSDGTHRIAGRLDRRLGGARAGGGRRAGVGDLAGRRRRDRGRRRRAGVLPQILLIFLFMSVLEDSGYMARAAFITDRLLRKFGLSGRSFIPMLMASAARPRRSSPRAAWETERDRRMTILLTPFMSCGARLPVYALFTAAFFPTTGRWWC